MPKLAILGGSFNPIHQGHLLMAEMARKQVNLDQVIWVPAQCPPHKQSIELADFQHRVEMVKRAIASYPVFCLSTVDQNRTGTSYAINTLLDLQTCYPNSQWYWIVGLDAFASLPRWYRRQELAANCSWLVAPRAGQPAEVIGHQVVQQLAAQSIKIDWQILQMPLVEISSSLVRQYCRDRRSLQDLVPESVENYILAHSLYR
ncbi:nicotinate (nicotinamide) nucleotide adenylyltransferase [Oculatella sp. FACHB-28]|uniref:nicotinate (nicotinamide) nucleotide adenylyltransferase n=1 Tax=Oculatella sp. FACHB-28 TaxID=2692845 RepID=UPI00168248FC|nr:nicotinate (nicotinamide) nucleotide adenylyltransferase [Oculatella sp. FACHB-28]MBD2055202.1 nicotinate (nicotinamide) nucleotide adenylyltransferase [Oculatella sp. FACHB-28]